MTIFIGFRLGDGVLTSSHARERYLSTFGPLNQHLSIANHTIVFIDSMNLVAKDRGMYVDGDVLPKELDDVKFGASVASGMLYF